jgi:UDP-glucose:(heptosyl)LPS alpha-1,3-glucosyltransferase
MKIALSFPGCHRRGGVERVMYECANYLVARGHEVHVFACEWEPAPGITYHEVVVPRGVRFTFGKRYKDACTAMVKREHFDVVNTHGAVCPIGGVEWVQSVHHAWLDAAKQFRSPMSLARWKQRLNPVHPVLLRLEKEHFLPGNYKHLIATTPRVRLDLQKYFGVPEQDVEIIPNGFSPTEFNPERRHARRKDQRRKLGLAEGDVVLLLVANELPRKGYPTILAAMRRLGNRNLKLIVIGRPSVEEVKNLATEAGLQNQILALGPCGDVAAMHAAADLFVLPTQYEAFCLAILESLGSGLPVITSGVPGARDAIVPGSNGYIVEDPNDADGLAEVLRPLLDHDRIAALSATTPATVEQYQWPNVLLKYEAVLAAATAAERTLRLTNGVEP